MLSGSDRYLSRLRASVEFWRREFLFTSDRDIRSVAHLIVQCSVVRFLIICNELVNILVYLKCRGGDTATILKLNVEFTRLFGKCADLDSIARFFEDLGCITWKLFLFALFSCLYCSLLSYIDVDVEVLASCGVVIPTRAGFNMGSFVFGANFFLQLIYTFLIFIRLLLIVSELSLLGG